MGKQTAQARPRARRLGRRCRPVGRVNSLGEKKLREFTKGTPQQGSRSHGPFGAGWEAHRNRDQRETGAIWTGHL